MESLKELYRIGPGPSSSHTLGVRNACLFYMNKYPNKDKYSVTLYGSLALTGKGHMSDKIIIDTFAPKEVVILFNNDAYDENPNTMVFDENGQDEMVIYSTGGGAIKVKGIENIVNQNIYPHSSLKEIKTSFGLKVSIIILSDIWPLPVKAKEPYKVTLYFSLFGYLFI